MSTPEPNALDIPFSEWVVYPAHQAALQVVWENAIADGEIIGLLVCGSVARGDALPGSDLDVRLLLAPGANARPFDARTLSGVWVERTYLTETAARDRMETRPMECFPYCEGRILHDSTGAVARLSALAQQQWENYTAPAEEKREWHNWLRATQRKITAAQNAGLTDKAAYLVTTGAWPILTGLFLAADRPLPPSGLVRLHLEDAAQRIDLPLETVYELWAAQTNEGRVNAALDVLALVLPRLAD